MDFHSLTRRELQSLCKLNKIPANITNVAMADALQALEIVEGIEDFLNISQSETNDLVEGSSPKAPQTRCRTSTRPKAKTVESENLPPTATRTTRRGSKQLGGDVEESKNNMVKTPAIATTTRRKVMATSSCQSVNNRLNECEEEVKKESIVQKAYSTRRSTRLTEKKSAEPRVKKESEKAIKMNSFVDEMNTSSKVESLDEAKPNAEVEDICEAFKNLDVLIEESAECSVVEKDMDTEVTQKSEDLDDLKMESDVTPNPIEDGGSEEKVKIEEEVVVVEKVVSLCEDDDSEEKLDSEEKFEEKVEIEEEVVVVEKVVSPCEDEDSEEKFEEKVKIEEQVVMVEKVVSPCEDDDSEEKLASEEKFDDGEVSSKEISEENDVVMAPEEDSANSLIDNNGSLESGDENLSGPPELEQEDMMCAVSEMKDQVLENNEYSSMASGMVLSHTDDEITKMDTEQVSENNVDEATLDAIPTIDTISTKTAEEVQVLKPENLFTEFREFPNKKTPSKKTPTPFKNMINIVSDDKENIGSGIKLQNVFVDEGKKIKKENNNENDNKVNKSLLEISIRQLRKQVKELTLKNINANENAAVTKEATTTRPALQVLCENQLVGCETMK